MPSQGWPEPRTTDTAVVVWTAMTASSWRSKTQRRMRVHEKASQILAQDVIHVYALNYILHAGESLVSNPSHIFPPENKAIISSYLTNIYTCISCKCPKLTVCKTQINLIFSNILWLTSSLLVGRVSIHLYILPRWKLWFFVESCLPSYWLGFNYSPYLSAFFFRNVSQVWLLFLSSL